MHYFTYFNAYWQPDRVFHVWVYDRASFLHEKEIQALYESYDLDDSYPANVVTTALEIFDPDDWGDRYWGDDLED